VPGPLAVDRAVSSVAAQGGLPGQAGYSAAKASVLGLSRALAAGWAGARVRVNAVVPGLFATPKVLGMPRRRAGLGQAGLHR
jgi:NAD(P)-dependent dehydrogenase (short-subunit alcohol dehydrogenase family)